LVSHRAIYTLKLGTKRADAVIADVQGALAIDFTESCDAWLGTQRLRLRIFRNQGAVVETDNNFTSWESKDGLTYRFSVRNRRNGEIHEQFRGIASLTGRASGGSARFSQPEELNFVLPKGAMFPTEHLILMIELARAGERHVARTVFDGATADGPHEISAVIGAERPAETIEVLGEAGNRPSWDMRWAFFPLASDSAEPDYELDARVLDNGVVAKVVLDYGDFTVVGSIEKFQVLPRPEC